jgi:trans-aconitate 2-methyltransferase
VSRDWDAATYDRVSDPQVTMAIRVLDRLPLDGDETVLDAGCGSGRVTELLLERLPEGRVIAVDQAESMVEHARERLGDRALVLQSDLTALLLGEQVDAVFSNAVFHWIADHQLLFERLFAALRPGGRLVAQCGGEGNIAAFHRVALAVAAEDPFARHFEGWKGPWNFAGASQTANRLERVGFEEVETWLEPYPVTPEDPRAYFTAVCLGPPLEQLPVELRERYVDEVYGRAGGTLDYVRLNTNARRPA